MAFYDYECNHCGIFEVQQGMNEEKFSVCPHCGNRDIIRLIALPAACITGGKQPNQYSDCKGFKHWRDKNGNLHPVTSADGDYKSATSTSRQYRSPEEVAAIKKRDELKRKKQRQAESLKRMRKQ